MVKRCCSWTGNKRHIRKDGLVCVSIVKAKDGTSEIDADFRLEEALLR